jgi:hypothetical protein
VRQPLTSGNVVVTATIYARHLRLSMSAHEAVHLQGSFLDIVLSRAVVVGGGGQWSCLLDADENDRLYSVRLEPAPFLVEAKTRLVDGTVPVDRCWAFEAVSLSHDRVDDVDLHDRVPGLDVCNGLRRVQMGEDEVFVVPHRRGSLGRQVRSPVGHTEAT